MAHGDWCDITVLSIQGVKEVEDTWANLTFSIQKYMTGTSDHGYILGTVEEVLQSLDDNATQLQGMAASMFIGPFFNSVQNWEKSLSHISEVLDVGTAWKLTPKFIPS